MFRKNLIIALSIIYILNGLRVVGASVYSLASSKSTDLSLIGGVLVLYVGFQLFQMHGLGRKLALFLLFIRMAINSVWIVWFFLHLSDPALQGGDISFLGKQVYQFGSPYVGSIFWFIWTIIVLVTIIFLSQGETKKIFALKTTSDASEL